MPISGSRLMRRPVNASFYRLKMIGASRINDLSKAVGDVDEVVAAAAIASTLEPNARYERRAWPTIAGD